MYAPKKIHWGKKNYDLVVKWSNLDFSFLFIPFPLAQQWR